MTEHIIITINGAKQTDLIYDLIEVVVDTNLHLPGMFQITVNDDLDVQSGQLKYTDADSPFKVGAEVKIEVETDEIPDVSSMVKATLIVGEITALEPAFLMGARPQLRVRGYDRSHRLTRGKKTRTYGDANPTGSGVTDEQIINTIVGETGGLTGKQVDTSGLSGIKYYYVMQYNQTDLDFLWTRARMLGYQVYVEDKTLYFQKADAHRGAASTKPADLDWGLNLASFEPRLTLVHQVDKAVVKGWDPKTKQAIEGTNSSDSSKTIPQIGLGKKGSALAKEAFSGTAEETVVDRPVLTVDQANAMAAARFAQAESTFIRAEGRCQIGDPRLIAGRVVTIKEVGQRFSGDYYVTEARHVWERDGYSITFAVTGRDPNTLSFLLDREDGHQGGLIQGVVAAKVVNLEDPETLGRVQVMYPWLPKYKGAELASNWARLASPMAGGTRGVFFMPEVDDEVLVAFEHGDPSYPYIVGVLWNSKDKPPTGTADILAGDKKKVNQRVICSRTGHLIILDDTEGEEQIIVQDKTKKNSIIIQSKDNAMAINAEGNVTIKAGGDLAIEAGGKLSIKSTGDTSMESQAKSTIKAMADLALEAMSKSTLKGTAGLTLETPANAELKGTQVTVNGNAQTEIKAGAMVSIQGALVKIN